MNNIIRVQLNDKISLEYELINRYNFTVKLSFQLKLNNYM
jgi:hypothetical protein